MVKLLWLVILCFTVSPTTAQHFEGYILYEYKYVDTLGQDITEKLGEKLGLEQHYFINGIDYVAFDQKNNLQQLYNSKDNNYYFAYNGVIQSVSGGLKYPPAPEILESTEEVTILGYKCESKIFDSAGMKTIYYFSDQITVNPEVFSRHRFGNWAEYLKNSDGGLPLKIVIEQEEFTQILEAVKIENRIIDKAKFDVSSYMDKK